MLGRARPDRWESNRLGEGVSRVDVYLGGYVSIRELRAEALRRAGDSASPGEWRRQPAFRGVVLGFTQQAQVCGRNNQL